MASDPLLFQEGNAARLHTNVVNDRRSESRSSADRVVEVRIMKGMRRTVPAHLIEVSLSGLRIRLDHRVAEGTQVEVLVDEEHVFGVVRYCVPAKDKFDAGVLIRYAIRLQNMSA
jgi:hypothetical protein